MNTLINALRNFLARREPTLEEQYLAEAVDLIDLEHRMRQLDDRRLANEGSLRLATFMR